MQMPVRKGVAHLAFRSVAALGAALFLSGCSNAGQGKSDFVANYNWNTYGTGTPNLGRSENIIPLTGNLRM